jgi:hypothetical protein
MREPSPNNRKTGGGKPLPYKEKRKGGVDPRQNSNVDSEGSNASVFVGAGFIPARVFQLCKRLSSQLRCVPHSHNLSRAGGSERHHVYLTQRALKDAPTLNCLETNTNQGVGTQMQDAGNPSIVSLPPAPWFLPNQSLAADTATVEA